VGGRWPPLLNLVPLELGVERREGHAHRPGGGALVPLVVTERLAEQLLLGGIELRLEG
jgi:hypothetical protein